MRHRTTRNTTSTINASRITAFSDGVIAVIITIIVLEIKIPAGYDWAALRSVLPIFLIYLLSFRQIGTYWNNHHHLLALAHRASGRLMWANLRFLFCLSLFPFVTTWLGEHYNKPLPVLCYGIAALLSGLAYNRVQAAVLTEYPVETIKQTPFGRDLKGLFSLFCYAVGIALAFVNTWAALAAYASVVLLWIAPEQRAEELLSTSSNKDA